MAFTSQWNLFEPPRTGNGSQSSSLEDGCGNCMDSKLNVDATKLFEALQYQLLVAVMGM
jgi:hypothetical protein